jgi:uncharacterized protein (DUF1778 family)
MACKRSGVQIPLAPRRSPSPEGLLIFSSGYWTDFPSEALPLDFGPLYCHCDYMANLKEERLQIRVNPDEKRLLEQAAKSAHLSVSAFVLQAASQQAEQLLAERQTITVSPDAAEAFARALSQPAAVNERLRAALGRTQKFRWID